MKEPKPRVVVLDAGAQYVDLIQKASERQGFPTVILPIDTPFDNLPDSTEAVIVSGGPSSSHTDGAPMPDEKLWKQNKIPTFNICYGMQAFALSAGGHVSTRGYRSDGRHTTTLDITHPLFTKVRKQTQALFTHGDFVDKAPKDVQIIGQHKANNGERIISAIARGPHVCVQFHPEVTDDTPQGYEIFSNFFEHIAKIKPDPDFLTDRLNRYIASKHELIKKRVGNKHVVAFVSGGVDSTTAVMLAKDVIAADKLHMYYIDNGFMRDEDDNVIETLQKIGLDVHIIHAEEKFENATAIIEGKEVGPLKMTVNPVHKRRIVGETFVDIQDEIVADLNLHQDDVVLLQGTSAADRIESGHSKGGGKATDQIKEHHNQVQRVKDLDPLEPIDDLFKDEIRPLAVALGLPDEIAYRQTFPGPGTSVRILGLDGGDAQEHSHEDEERIAAMTKRLNKQHGTKLTTHLLPVRSVGVGGDSRSHVQAVAIEGTIQPQQMAHIAHQFTSEFRGLINRVVYKLAGPDIVGLKPVETHLTRNMRCTIRQADAITMDVSRQMNVMRDVEQFPVILIPLGANGKRSIVLRPLQTRAYLTAQALIPGVDLPQKFFDTVAERIINEVDDISHVFVDLTNKPPATMEWE